jgi:hypothetical protein
MKQMGYFVAFVGCVIFVGCTSTGSVGRNVASDGFGPEICAVLECGATHAPAEPGNPDAGKDGFDRKCVNRVITPRDHRFVEEGRYPSPHEELAVINCPIINGNSGQGYEQVCVKDALNKTCR